MIFKHTCVQDNRDHLLLGQFGFARQRLFHQLIDALDLASVAFVRTFHSVAALITDDVRPFFEWLGGYVVVAGSESVSASASSGVLGTHRFFEVEIWSAWTASVTKHASFRWYKTRQYVHQCDLRGL